MKKIIVGRPLTKRQKAKVKRIALLWKSLEKDGMAIIAMEGNIIFIRDFNVPSADLCEMICLLEMDMSNWEEPGIAIRDNYCP